MPQLSQIGAIYASQLFWLAIVFGLIYFGIGKAMVPKIERTIDDRAATVSGNLAAAETAHAQARDADLAYQAGLETARSQALAVMGKAKDQAGEASAATVKSGDTEAADKIAAAATRIAEARTRAMGEIEAATVEATRDIVAKLSGVSVDAQTVAAQVKTELAHG